MAYWPSVRTLQTSGSLRKFRVPTQQVQNPKPTALQTPGHHPDDATERDHGEALSIVETSDLSGQQTNGCNHPHVVVNAASQRADRANGKQGQRTEAQSAWHEEAEIPKLNPGHCGTIYPTSIVLTRLASNNSAVLHALLVAQARDPLNEPGSTLPQICAGLPSTCRPRSPKVLQWGYLG